MEPENKVIKFTGLKRSSIIELVNRYEDYITNTEIDKVMGVDDFLQDEKNKDLRNKEHLYPNESEFTDIYANIVDTFEDLLEEHDITIPNEDREEALADPDADLEDGGVILARLFGMDYYCLEDKVKDIIQTRIL